jgi:hypothetical protein
LEENGKGNEIEGRAQEPEDDHEVADGADVPPPRVTNLVWIDVVRREAGAISSRVNFETVLVRKDGKMIEGFALSPSGRRPKGVPCAKPSEKTSGTRANQGQTPSSVCMLSDLGKKTAYPEP